MNTRPWKEGDPPVECVYAGLLKFKSGYSLTPDGRRDFTRREHVIDVYFEGVWIACFIAEEKWADATGRGYYTPSCDVEGLGLRSVLNGHVEEVMAEVEENLDRRGLAKCKAFVYRKRMEDAEAVPPPVSI